MYNGRKISLRKENDDNYENNSPSEFVEQKKYEPMSYEEARRIYGSPKYIQDQVHDHPELSVKYNDERMNSKHQFSSSFRGVERFKETNTFTKFLMSIFSYNFRRYR